MKKILIFVIVIVGLGIVSRSLVPNQSAKTSDDVRIPDTHFVSVENAKENSDGKASPLPVTLREKIRRLEDQIQQYENILQSENAIDRINHNEVTDEQRQQYFKIIRELTSMRIQKTNLKIEELENEG